MEVVNVASILLIEVACIEDETCLWHRGVDLAQEVQPFFFGVVACVGCGLGFVRAMEKEVWVYL